MKSDFEHFAFEGKGIQVIFPETDTVLLPLIPASLVFENICFNHFVCSSDQIAGDIRRLSGEIVDTRLRFDALWERCSSWVRFSMNVQGTPEREWGAFQSLILLELSLPGTRLEAGLGWRELGKTASETLMERPLEEGGGMQPPFGFPIFGPDFFLGAEHPMACIEAQEGGQVNIAHHPLWQEAELQSIPLVVGVCREQESPAAAFGRYFATIRRPQPERAIVEINTFWTDGFDPVTYYAGMTDIASYQAMAEYWAREILGGEEGLVSHFLLDAGWQERASLYRPEAANGGPGDEALAGLGEFIQSQGFAFGLWFSLNGPIGVDVDWASAQGYRTSDQGTGAGYSANNGKIRYMCLTDERWEEDLACRFEELIRQVPVSFFKGDWDNDAVEDPARFSRDPVANLQLREAAAKAMIRIYRRMHGARPDVALRGAWWLSPWWFPHVDSTHLPNSGDHENCDVPSMTHRDSGMTCRDSMCYQVMIRSQTSIPWDVLCPHEFASSRRNPVADTDDSWMNNLAMWVSRGTQYLQLYLAPYGLEGWKSWSLREILRWFRADEALHWKCGTRMLGSDPISGGVYAYFHEDGERSFLTVRNPLAHPQALPDLRSWGLSDEGWEQIYPYCQAFNPGGWMMASHEVRMLCRGKDSVGTHRLVNTVNGWRKPWSPGKSIPRLHQLEAPKARIETLDINKLAIHATLPYGLISAEVVLSVRASGNWNWRSGLGRYEEDVASFGVPVTCVRPHWQSGFAQQRLKAPPYNPELGVIRFPIATGGESHAFLFGDTELPKILGAWIEVRENLLPAGDPEVTRPPAMNHPSHCLLSL